LRILRIIAMVKAVEIALRRFTPRTQRYCVMTLMPRKKMCRGMWIGKGIRSRRRGWMWRGGELRRTRKSRVMRGRRGMKKGMERKCYGWKVRLVHATWGERVGTV